jgi:hypothetical protein
MNSTISREDMVATVVGAATVMSSFIHVIHYDSASAAFQLLLEFLEELAEFFDIGGSYFRSGL